MIVVEIVFAGQGGLDQLMDQAATALEGVFGRHNLEWSQDYPVTLREALCLGLQKQMVGGSVCQCVSETPKKKAYRVWMALPDGGLRAWTNQLVDQILAGCGKKGVPPTGRLRKELQKVLVAQLGPYMERSEIPPLLAGIS